MHVELRNAAGHLVPFFPIGQVQLTLLFQKNLDHFLNYHYKKRSAKKQKNSLSHSMLDFCGRVPILDPILWSNEQQIFATNFLNKSTIEFQMETDRNICTDLRSTRLFIRGRVIKGD